MALDAARGLQALHEAPGGPIVHFDIKPHQMMLDANGRLKINDLNLVRFPRADKDGNSCPFKSSASGVGERERTTPEKFNRPCSRTGPLDLSKDNHMYVTATTKATRIQHSQPPPSPGNTRARAKQ